MKMENNEFKEVSIEILTSYCFDGIIKFADFDFGNILIEAKSH